MLLLVVCIVDGFGVFLVVLWVLAVVGLILWNYCVALVSLVTPFDVGCDERGLWFRFSAFWVLWFDIMWWCVVAWLWWMGCCVLRL